VRSQAQRPRSDSSAAQPSLGDVSPLLPARQGRRWSLVWILSG
jgi:hypothetical protein